MNYSATISDTSKSLSMLALLKDPTLYKRELDRQVEFIDDVISIRRDILINLIYMNNSVSDKIDIEKDSVYTESISRIADLIEGHRSQSKGMLESYKRLLFETASNNNIDLEGKNAIIPAELKDILNNYEGSNENMIDLRHSEYIISDIANISNSLIKYLNDYNSQDTALDDIKYKIKKTMREEARRIKDLLNFKGQVQKMINVSAAAMSMGDLINIKMLVE